MSAQSNAAPVIIKRKKVVAGGGHHGGAWKVAYADFVTAMMAFFMLMWLLNATTEKQRKGIADYFNPSIPLSRVSGGGNGAFGGDSVFSDQQMAETGTGAVSRHSTPEKQAAGQTGTKKDERPVDGAVFVEAEKKVDATLSAFGGESMTAQNALKHIVTRVTDEGLIIEFFDLDNEPLFNGDTADPTATTTEVIRMLNRILDLVTNQIAVNGHTRMLPEVIRVNPSWDLSTARAMAVRNLLEKGGLEKDRMLRVTGFADRQPSLRNPAAAGNNRIEVVLLRAQP